MAINMKEMVDQLKTGGLPATAHLEYPELVELAYQMYRNANIKGVLFILNRVRDDLTEQYLRDRLAEKQIKPVGVIHDTPAISMAWLMGEPLIKTSAQREAELIVQAIETIDNAHTDSEGEVHDLQAAY
jgi:hypothetical protein